MSGSVALQHVRELAARKSKAYELLLALDGNSSADESCFQSLSRAVDRLLFNEISLDSAALTSLSALVSEPAEDLGSTLAVLDVALSEAEPERARLQILISGFSGWLTAASHAARPHVLSILPNIAVHVSELKNSGVETLISLFNACSSEREMDLIARCIAGYQESSGEILLAASEIGSRFVRSGVDALIERMLTAVPVDAMLESKDAEALLPAIAKIRVDRADDAVLSAAAAVCIAAARQNNSSALNLARQLGGAVSPLPPELRVAYLKAFESIVNEAGISLIGYATRQLPGLFQKAGTDRAGAFVAEGLAIARRYGKVAAQEFFEQKTAAAKQAAPGG